VPSQQPNRGADFGRCPFPAGLRPPARLRRPSSGKASFPARRPAQRARVGDAGWNGQLEGAGTRALPPTLLRSADGSGPSPLSDFTARHLDVQKYDSVPNRSSFADRAHSRRNAAFQAIMDRPKVHARAGLRRSSIAGSYSITWSLDHRATARTRHKTLDTKHRPPPGGHLQLWLEAKPVRGHYNKHLQEDAAGTGGLCRDVAVDKSYRETRYGPALYTASAVRASAGRASVVLRVGSLCRDVAVHRSYTETK